MTAAAELIERMIAAHNSRDDEALRRCYAADATVDPGGSPQPVPAAAWVLGLASLRESFPDLHFEVRTLVAGPRAAMVELTLTGTNDGPLHLGDVDRMVLRTEQTSLPATGRSISVDGIVVVEVGDGLVAAERHYWQQVEWLVQLGVGPAAIS